MSTVLLLFPSVVHKSSSSDVALCSLFLCSPRRWCHQSVEELCRPGEEPGDGDGLAGAVGHAADYARWVPAALQGWAL